MRAAAHDPKKARAAAEDFEAFFLGQFATLMFGNLGQGDYFSGGPAEGIYRSMLAEEIGKTAARSVCYYRAISRGTKTNPQGEE